MPKSRTSKERGRGRPSTGQALTAAERMRRMRARRRAQGLKPVVTWVDAVRDDPGVYSSHRLLEARSLAMHAVIAEKIRRRPALLQKVRANLARWRAAAGHEAPPWLIEWEQLIERPWLEIAALITAPTEEGARLRQSSPFAGVLTPKQRERIYEALRP